MERRGAAKQCDLVIAPAEASGDLPGGPPHALGVLVGGVVAVLSGDCKPLKRLEAGLLQRLGPLTHGPLENVALILQRLFGLPLGRDVARRHIEPLLSGHGPDAPLEPAILAIGSPEPVAEDRARCALDHERDLGLRPDPVIGMNEVVHRPGAELGRGVTERLLPGGVQLLEATCEAGRAEEVERQREVALHLRFELAPAVDEQAEQTADDDEGDRLGRNAEGAYALVGRDVGSGRQPKGEGRSRQAAAKAELHRADGDRNDEEDQHRVGGLLAGDAEGEDREEEDSGEAGGQPARDLLIHPAMKQPLALSDRCRFLQPFDHNSSSAHAPGPLADWTNGPPAATRSDRVAEMATIRSRR